MASNRGSAPTDDSDLEDLIAKKPVGRQPQVASSANASPLGFCSGLISLCCYKFPCCCKCLLALMVLGLIAFVSNTLFNPAQKMGIMGADYSAITSAYDLSLSKVDHWCIQGDNDSCKCEDPLEPNSRSEFKSWNAAHKANVKDVNLYRAVYGSDPTLIDEETGKPRPPIDVAFLGESVVEAMDGRWLGKRVVRSINTVNGREGPEARKKPDIGKVFERLFRKEKGGPVEGVALGVAGDNTANVLWRLQHDEMPYDFNPKVWWLVLGMNDLTRMQCSEEIVVLGVLRVVEEIKLRKPDAHIVINSLLPMINYQRPAPPKMADFADFKRDKDGMRENMEIEKAKKEYMQKKGGKGRNLRERSRSRKHKKTKKQRQEDEENASEGPDLEKALERRKKILEARDKRVRDKVFKDNEKYRPKKPISPFLPMIKKKVMPPVWPSVHLINDKLKEFCTKHDTITFFDATPIFASNEGGGSHRLHNELISPRGHPSEMGFAVWEGNIMGRLHKLLMDREERKPDPPLAAHDTDDKESEEDPGAEVLEPVHETKASGDDVSGDGESGDGVEHVSEGKESDPPKVSQPKRVEEQPKSEEVDEDSSEEVEGDKDNKGKKAKGSSAKENVEVESDKEEGDNSGDEEDDEEEEVTKKMRKKKTEEKEDEEEPEEDEVPKKVRKKKTEEKEEEEEEPEEDEEDGDDEDGDDDEEEEDDEEE